VRIVDMHAMGRALYKAIWKNMSPHYKDGELQKIALGNSWGSPRLQAGVNLLLPDLAMIHPHRSTPPEMQRGRSIMRSTFWILVAFSLLFVNSKRAYLERSLDEEYFERTRETTEGEDILGITEVPQCSPLPPKWTSGN
jgi:hypothetical protein